jgi:hypothetical protein
MVHILVEIKEDVDSFRAIDEFNENIFNNQVSNIMFKDDSFIRFVNPNMVLIYLNTMIPKEIPFFLIFIMYVVGFVFALNILLWISLAFTIIFITFHNMIFYLFKLGLRKKGFKGKIEAI